MTHSRRLWVGLILAVLSLVATLALPVRTWRTGRMSVPALTFSAREPLPLTSGRVWVDMDAACGAGPRTDVDDCLALWLLAPTPGLEIVGVSTVFGNAPIEVTDHTTRELIGLLRSNETHTIVVHRGAGQPFVAGIEVSTPARDELRRALESGPLTVIALGPLTNLAQALEGRADLHVNVNRLVAADYDLWVDIDDIEKLNASAAAFDLAPTHSADEARRRGRYVLENGEHVDVIVARVVPTIDGRDVVFRDLWDRRQSVVLTENVFVSLPSLDDLILTKHFSARPKDLEDIRLLTILRGEGARER